MTNLNKKDDRMQIKLMTITDYEDLMQLWKSTPGMGLNTIDDSKHGIEKYLKRNPNTCFVAKERDELLGAILTGHDGRRGFIYHLSVKMEKRRKGIGKKLVETALEALKSECIMKVALVVFKHNIIGNTFWDKIGFAKRDDLIYRNMTISDIELIRIDT